MPHQAPPLRLALVAASLAATALGMAFHTVWLLLIPATAWIPDAILQHRRSRHAAEATEAARHAALAHRKADQLRGARRDTLTCLPNRRAFLEALSTQFATGKPFATIAIDLDGFDTINANLGEAAGDEILCHLADRLRACSGRDRAARLDGDSFALILTDPADLRHPQDAATRILAALAGTYTAAGQIIDVPASLGLAIAPQHGPTPEAILRAARLATQQSKQAGGSRVTICGADLADIILARQTSRRDMQRAIEAGQFVPYYQPIVRLPEGGIAKFEVLARWLHPTHGILLPDQFIPMADEMGLAGQISLALLRRMAAETDIWPSWCRFAINISAGQVRELISLLKTQPGDWQRRMDLSRLDVEIAECALMRDRAMARDLIDILHEHGARAVLDDFGSGTSNFFHLQDLPFDSLKIGKSFIQSLTGSPRIQACVTSMLTLGAGLDIDIVADGVETQQAADLLTQMGCELAQGFLYAHPMPAEDAARLLGLTSAIAEAA